MAKRLYIPKKVLEAISSHIDKAIDEAVEGFWSANEDEDTLTGHMGACLKSKIKKVEVSREQREEILGTWRWSIDYSKFRGRGIKATESLIGADGIIELKLEFGHRVETKSLLFQSKLDWSNDSNIVKQALLLSNWREASIVVNYTPNCFSAYSIDDVVSSRGSKKEVNNEVNLKEALKEYFLKCEIGNTELSYDAITRGLAWRTESGLIVASKFSIPNRIRVNIKAPQYLDKFDYDKLIQAEDIHSHRMQVEPDEIIKPLLTHKKVKIKNQRKALSLNYHPDKFSIYEKHFQDIANKRMQEINAAYNEIKEKEERLRANKVNSDDAKKRRI